MRCLFVLAALIGLAASAHAQGPKIGKVYAGFADARPESGPRHLLKEGMWAPVAVEVEAGAEPLDDHRLDIEAVDADGVANVYPVPIKLGANAKKTFVGIVRTSRARAIKVGLYAKDRLVVEQPCEAVMPVALNGRFVVTLGGRLPALEFGEKQAWAQGVVESLDHLPTSWHGYQGVDLVVLSTTNKEFLTGLTDDHRNAIGAWVARGGRLLLPIDWKNKAQVRALLNDWDPKPSVVPPADRPELTVEPHDPFKQPGLANLLPPGTTLAELSPEAVKAGLWDVRMRLGAGDGDEPGKPIIARLAFGTGSITYLAFSIDAPNFEGKKKEAFDFLSQILDRLAPPLPRATAEQRAEDQSDVTTRLYDSLDRFDTASFPFGVVALFMVLYLLAIGPLDYFLLRRVFGRMSLTWITLPFIIAAVSAASLYWAERFKGDDLKRNQIDVVDVDMRSIPSARGELTEILYQGHTFFTLRSPKFERFDVREAIAPSFLSIPTPNNQISAYDTETTWLGRNDPGVLRSIGAAETPGGTGRPYRYEAGFKNTSLVGVPIAKWGTRSFEGAWTSRARYKREDIVKLHYYPTSDPANERVKVTGTIRHGMAATLHDATIIYGDRCYVMDESWPADKEIDVKLESARGVAMTDWAKALRYDRDPPAANVEALQAARNILFFYHLHQLKGGSNHSQRMLDWSWRIAPEVRGNDGSLREVIVVARAGDGKGPTLAPGDSVRRDTLVRMILPVTPASAKD